MSSDVKFAAAYIRVSTEDQAEYSPDAQLAEIRKYAAQNGYVIPGSLIFIDEGISGKRTEKRDAFNHMIGLAKSKPKPFEAILLWKFSRFARNREDSVVYKSMLRKQLGIDVLSVSEPVGDDKMSILIEALIEAMDEYYSINLAEEVKRGMTEKARRGEIQAAPAFGYRVENKVLVPIPEEAALIQEIFSRFIGGQGLYPIAKWLNNLGIRTHRGNNFDNRAIEYIIRNPVYIGKLRWNPAGRTDRDYTNKNIITADSTHEPLISNETWETAQNRMALVKAQWKYHGRPLSEHKEWFSGLVRCSECEQTLIFSKPHYWKCNGYARGQCRSSQHISDEKLKDMLLSRLEYDASDCAVLEFHTVHSCTEKMDEAGILQEQLFSLDSKLLRLREAYLAGIESLESYAAAKELLDARRADLKEKISDLKIAPDDKKNDALLRKSIGTVLDILRNSDATMEEKHEAAHSIVDRCIFNKAENTLIITYRLFLDL